MGDKSKGLHLALTAGDDYELVLTVAEAQQEQLQQRARETKVAITLIGRVVKGSRVKCLDREGREIDITTKGYQHF